MNSLEDDIDESSILDDSDIGKILKNNIQDQRLAEQLAKTVETIIEHKVKKILNEKRPSTEMKQERFFNEARRKLSQSKNVKVYIEFSINLLFHQKLRGNRVYRLYMLPTQIYLN